MPSSAMPSSPSPIMPKRARTPDGILFDPAPTTDMFAALISPSNWGPSEMFTLLILSLTVCTIPLIPYLPLSFFVLLFLFWRLSYNIILARILHLQSRRQYCTHLVSKASPSARALMNWAVTRSVRAPYRWQDYPPSFNAWLVFRALSMLILANDGVSYFVLVVATFRPLSASSWPQLMLCLPMGLALILFSLWSKADAHHVLGDYAWYWGDFFFLQDLNLSFDGVFKLFPHPMYTVGYAAYYGCALICRSYTLLAVSLAAHILQMAFLALVEEPHINMIYAPKPTTPLSTQRSQAPLTDHQRFIDAAPSPLVCAVLCLVVGVVTLLSISASPSRVLVLALAVVFRAVHWRATAFLLHAPSRAAGGGTDALSAESSPPRNRFVAVLSALRYSKNQIYSSWQHVFLASYMLNHALFLIACSQHGTFTTVHASLSKAISLLLSGSSLMFIAAISVLSSWRTIGLFGFFYGDFFVDPQSRELKSHGSFRYVSNPQLSLGYLAYYGLAVIRQSNTLFMLTVVCQCMEYLFVRHVGTPHLLTVYKLVERRTALETAALRLPLVSKLMALFDSAMVTTWVKVQDVNQKHVPSLRREMNLRKERLGAQMSKSVSKAWDSQCERTQGLKNKAESVVRKLNAESLVSALETRGIVVERVREFSESAEVRDE